MTPLNPSSSNQPKLLNGSLSSEASRNSSEDRSSPGGGSLSRSFTGVDIILSGVLDTTRDAKYEEEKDINHWGDIHYAGPGRFIDFWSDEGTFGRGQNWFQFVHGAYHIGCGLSRARLRRRFAKNSYLCSERR